MSLVKNYSKVSKAQERCYPRSRSPRHGRGGHLFARVEDDAAHEARSKV